MNAHYCVQCKSIDGKTGSFVFTGSLAEGRTPISPVFPSLAELYPWMQSHGWSQVPHGSWNAVEKSDEPKPNRESQVSR